MKRLFQIRKPNGQIFGSATYDNKQQAKRDRDALIKEYGEGFTVTRGPDHIGKHGSKGRKPRRGNVRGVSET